MHLLMIQAEPEALRVLLQLYQRSNRNDRKGPGESRDLWLVFTTLVRAALLTLGIANQLLLLQDIIVTPECCATCLAEAGQQRTADQARAEARNDT